MLLIWKKVELDCLETKCGNVAWIQIRFLLFWYNGALLTCFGSGPSYSVLHDHSATNELSLLYRKLSLANTGILQTAVSLISNGATHVHIHYYNQRSNLPFPTPTDISRILFFHLHLALHTYSLKFLSSLALVLIIILIQSTSLFTIIQFILKTLIPLLPRFNTIYIQKQSLPLYSDGMCLTQILSLPLRFQVPTLTHFSHFMYSNLCVIQTMIFGLRPSSNIKTWNILKAISAFFFRCE